MVSHAFWIFWVNILLHLMFSLTDEFISSIESSMLEILSSIFYILLLMIVFVVPDDFLIIHFSWFLLSNFMIFSNILFVIYSISLREILIFSYEFQNPLEVIFRSFSSASSIFGCSSLAVL